MKTKIQSIDNISIQLAYSTEVFKNEEKIKFNDKGYYMYGDKQISNFFFVINDKKKVYNHRGDIVELIYSIEMIFAEVNSLVEIVINNSELSNAKWIKNISAPMIVDFETKYYKDIVNRLIPKIKTKSENFYTADIGLNRVEGKYIFSTSNSIITEEGINKNSFALIPDFNFNISDIAEQDAIKKFIEYTERNIKILLPLHMMSIMAICRNYFADIGITFGINLWMDGNYGSGKTELATIAGNFYNRQTEYNSIVLKKNLLISNIKHSNIVDSIGKFNNSVVILDDVKKEESNKHREAAKNNIDFIIRTIFTGQYENEPINAVSIITGEYFNNQSSTISRLLYINIEDFLSNKENRKLLSDLQDNNYYLSDFIFGFTRWYLGKINRNELKLEVQNIYSKLKYDIDNHADMIYCSERIKETVANFILAFEIVCLYTKEKGFEHYIVDMKDTVMSVLMKWANSTELLVQGFKPLIKRAFFSALYQDAKYRKYSNYFEEMKDHAETVALKSLTPKYTGVFLEIKNKHYDSRAEITLLVRKKELVTKIINKVMEFAEQYDIYVYNYQRSTKYIIKCLSEMHLIWCSKRSRNDGIDREFRLFEISFSYVYEQIQSSNNRQINTMRLLSNNEEEYNEIDIQHVDDNEYIDNNEENQEFDNIIDMAKRTNDSKEEYKGETPNNDCWDTKEYGTNIELVIDTINVLKVNTRHPDFNINYFGASIYSEDDKKRSKMYKVLNDTIMKKGRTGIGYKEFSSNMSVINNAIDLE